jgi:outer membrane protein OmpA-like peptidoglycan-associated protein
VVSNRVGVGDGLTSSPEVLLGLSVTLGRKKERKAKPGAGDRDGDRILDRDDYCPDVFGEPPRGCPQVCIDDSDGDGLSNPVDKCPTDPETRNGFEESDGCPDEVPPELGDLSGIMEGITFDTDKDTIKSGSKARIDRAVEVMKKYPELRVRVSGHTDSQGPYRHNVDLSKRRAKSVKRYMVESGIDDSRIETEGFGPDQPIDTNETADGRAKNRRIEFTIIQDTEGVAVETKGGDPAAEAGDGGGASGGGP